MDGQGRLEGHVVIVPLVADDVFVRVASAADLLAVLQMAAPARPARRVDLHETARAKTVVRAEVGRWEIADGSWVEKIYPICYLPSPISEMKTMRKSRAA